MSAPQRACAQQLNGVTALLPSEEITEERQGAGPSCAGLGARVLDARVTSPKKLSQELGAPLGAVADHVRVLASLNLIRLVELPQRRGSLEHRYTAARRPIGDRS